MENDELLTDEPLSGEEDECMYSSRFSPSLNTSSRSIKKGGGSGKSRKPTMQTQMVEGLNKLVA